jgi:hypothetical protein
MINLSFKALFNAFKFFIVLPESQQEAIGRFYYNFYQIVSQTVSQTFSFNS